VIEQFSHLTASQKMLAAAIFIAVFPLLVDHLRQQADMECYFDQPMSADQLLTAPSWAPGSMPSR
jgi:hypothetical protein